MKWLLTKTSGVDSTRRYMAWVTRNGIEPVTAEPGAARRNLAGFSALLLTGGGDVNPARYARASHPKTCHVEDERDGLEFALVRRFLRLKKPIFGVCRGIQVLNVALGGTLIQHVPDYLRGKKPSERHAKRGRSDARHPLRFTGRSRLAAACRPVRYVNSSHHQAVDPEGLAPGLRVTALSPAGVIEAVEETTLRSPVLGVQWHPERLPEDHPASRGLMELMVALCRRGTVCRRKGKIVHG